MREAACGKRAVAWGKIVWIAASPATRWMWLACSQNNAGLCGVNQFGAPICAAQARFRCHGPTTFFTSASVGCVV